MFAIRDVVQRIAVSNDHVLIVGHSVGCSHGVDIDSRKIRVLAASLWL